MRNKPYAVVNVHIVFPGGASGGKDESKTVFIYEHGDTEIRFSPVVKDQITSALADSLSIINASGNPASTSEDIDNEQEKSISFGFHGEASE